jgi:hypothetical protein
VRRWIQMYLLLFYHHAINNGHEFKIIYINHDITLNISMKKKLLLHRHRYINSNKIILNWMEKHEVYLCTKRVPLLGRICFKNCFEKSRN